jgi:hypothetical protein
MHRRVALLACLALLLAGCSAAAARFDTARQRWQAQPIAHYLLRTQEQARGRQCDQAIEVRGRALERVVSSSCRLAWPWTVEGLFSYVESLQANASGCARLVVGVGCVCRHDVEMSVRYDPALGYPRSIQTAQTWAPNWQDQGFWRYAVASRAIPDCTPPANASFRRLEVIELRALP